MEVIEIKYLTLPVVDLSLKLFIQTTLKNKNGEVLYDFSSIILTRGEDLVNKICIEHNIKVCVQSKCMNTYGLEKDDEYWENISVSRANHMV